MEATTYWFVERLQKINDDGEKDIHITVRLFGEPQTVQEVDHDTFWHEIIAAIDEMDEVIDHSINQNTERSSELSDIDMWEPCEPAGEEEQALVDENYQIQKEGL